MISERDMKGWFWFLFLAGAGIGWCVIEGIIWVVKLLCRHLHWVS